MHAVKTSINTTFSRSPFLLFAGYFSFLTLARAEGFNQRIMLNTYFETDQGSRYLMLVERLTFSSLLCTNFLRFQARSLCLKTESRKEGVKKILDFLGWGGGASRPLFLIYTCKILKLKQKCCPFVGWGGGSKVRGGESSTVKAFTFLLFFFLLIKGTLPLFWLRGPETARPS